MSYSGHSREKNQSLGKVERTPRVEKDGTVEGEESRQELRKASGKETLPLGERLLSVLQEVSERIKPLQPNAQRRPRYNRMSQELISPEVLGRHSLPWEYFPFLSGSRMSQD
jgi:hypothetical protein